MLKVKEVLLRICFNYTAFQLILHHFFHHIHSYICIMLFVDSLHITGQLKAPLSRTNSVGIHEVSANFGVGYGRGAGARSGAATELLRLAR